MSETKSEPIEVTPEQAADIMTRDGVFPPISLFNHHREINLLKKRIERLERKDNV